MSENRLTPQEAREPDNFNLPFKPFSPAEVVLMTGMEGRQLDEWVVKGTIPVSQGEGVTGLDFPCAFAAYVGWRYLQEGGGPDRASRVIKFLVGVGLATIIAHVRQGNSFASPPQTYTDPRSPFPVDVPGTFVKPPKSRLGRALDLKKLYAEFTHGVERVFPGCLNEFPRLSEVREN